MTQTLPQAPKVGFRFTHSRFLDQDNQPIDMVVTAVRCGTVYYRGTDGKGSWSCAVDRFAEKVKADPPAALGDVGKCPRCGQQSRSYSRGCSLCGFGRPA